MSQTSSQTEETFTVKEYKHTHTHAHTRTNTPIWGTVYIINIVSNTFPALCFKSTPPFFLPSINTLSPLDLSTYGGCDCHEYHLVSFS